MKKRGRKRKGEKANTITVPRDEVYLRPSLERICSIVSTLSEKVRKDVLKGPIDKPHLRVLAYWLAKAAKSYDVALLLWKNGYWQDAAMIGRTVQEIALQAMYFRKDPDKFARQFFEHEESERNVLFKEMAKYTDSDKVRSEIERFFAKANVDPTKIKKQRNWWGNKTVWALAGEVTAQNIYTGAETMYKSQYGPLSMLVHATPYALSYYFVQEGRTTLIDWKKSTPRPARRDLAETMFTAAPTGLLDVIAVVAAIWQLDYEELFSAAREAILRFSGERALKQPCRR